MVLEPVDKSECIIFDEKEFWEEQDLLEKEYENERLNDMLLNIRDGFPKKLSMKLQGSVFREQNKNSNMDNKSMQFVYSK